MSHSNSGPSRKLRFIDPVAFTPHFAWKKALSQTGEQVREAMKNRIATQSETVILLFNVESEAELEILNQEAGRIVDKGAKPPATAIRVNPDVLAGGHPHIATGRHEHKFGLDWKEAKRLYLAHRNSKWIRWDGLSAPTG